MTTALVPASSLTPRNRRVAEPVEHRLHGPLVDALDRPLTDLRLSVTDRCNFRCTYCMPRGGTARPMWSAAQQMLSFDELTAVAAAFVDLGVTKLRITGGEPLLRPNLHLLVQQLARLGVDDLCLTTNGSLLGDQAARLAAAGLRRVTVSLDAIDEVTFRRMSDSRTPIGKVLSGIETARSEGLAPLKINMVVKRGVNEHSLVPMADWARSEGLELRFIEYMDVGSSNGWQSHDVVSAAEIHAAIDRWWPLEPMPVTMRGQTAARYRYRDGRGTIGIVASITRPFCGDCTRARVTAYGRLHACLFAAFGYDLAQVLRGGNELGPTIAAWWKTRADRYSELRASLPAPLPRPEMSTIGG